MLNYALKIIVISYLLLIATTTNAQNVRGMYVDGFEQILGNEQKENCLLTYAHDSLFNYLALYGTHVVLNNTANYTPLANFIKKARTQYGIQYVGAIGENYNFFGNAVKPYNLSRTDSVERFNVFNVEFEFWNSGSVSSGNYYCNTYLAAAGLSCDTAGAFRYYKRLLQRVDSLATTQNVLSETYVGWFNQGQANQIVPYLDRILLHAYRTNPSTCYNYTRTRLSYLGNTPTAQSTPLVVIPIFSSEPSFMGNWIQNHPQIDAYNTYYNDFNNETATWKQHINLSGYQWFTYSDMPHCCLPNIVGNAQVCSDTAETYSISAAAGSSYNWTVVGGNIISGQNTNSIQIQWDNNTIGSLSVIQTQP